MTGHRPGPSTSPWLPTAPCHVAHCLPRTQLTVSQGRGLLRVVAVCGVLLAGIAGAPVAWCLGRRSRYALVRLWARTLLYALGVRLRVRGRRAATRPALVVANHISWLDVVVLAAVCPGRMLAKAEVNRYPVLGAFARSAGTLFIERDRLRELPDVVARVTRALRQGSTVVVFPEGTTWCGRRQGPFRPALFEAAVQARVPVRPVALHYRQRGQLPSTVVAFVGDDTLAASLRRVLWARELSVEAVLSPPLDRQPTGIPRARRGLARQSADLVVTPCAATDYAREHDRAPSG